MFEFFCTLITIMFIIATIKCIFSGSKKNRRKRSNSRKHTKQKRGSNKYINNYEKRQKKGKGIIDHVMRKSRNIRNADGYDNYKYTVSYNNTNNYNRYSDNNSYENYNSYEEYEDYRDYEQYEKEKPSDKLTRYLYRFKNLLTNTEYAFYKVLRGTCDANNLLICPKVRLEDFVEVTDYQEKYKFRAYIRSRHIDFIICDSSLRVLAGVELDDSSHNSQKAKENDLFKDNVFKVIGIPLFRVKTSNRNYQQQVDYIMNHIMSF